MPWHWLARLDDGGQAPVPHFAGRVVATLYLAKKVVR